MIKPVKTKSGRIIEIAQVYGARDGVIGDTYIGDIHIHPPTQFAIDKRGQRMWSVWRRPDHKACSYHKSKAAAVRAMRKIVRDYFR